jgi:hypothetical protein
MEKEMKMQVGFCRSGMSELGLELLDVKEILEAQGCSEDEVKRAMLKRVGGGMEGKEEPCKAAQLPQHSTLTEKGLRIVNPTVEDAAYIKALASGDPVAATIGDMMMIFEFPPMQVTLAGDIPEELMDEPAPFRRGIVYESSANL